jgi:hypothetical protein
LDPIALDMQLSSFVLTMKNNFKGAMAKLKPAHTLMEAVDQITNCCAKDVKVYQVGRNCSCASS